MTWKCLGAVPLRTPRRYAKVAAEIDLAFGDGARTIRLTATQRKLPLKHPDFGGDSDSSFRRGARPLPTRSPPEAAVRLQSAVSGSVQQPLLGRG